MREISSGLEKINGGLRNTICCIFLEEFLDAFFYDAFTEPLSEHLENLAGSISHPWLTKSQTEWLIFTGSLCLKVYLDNCLI